MTTDIVKDEREITAFFRSYDNTQGEQVGKKGVTKIKRYIEKNEYESGFCIYKPYLAIYKGDTIAYRTLAVCIKIVYRQNKTKNLSHSPMHTQ